MKAAPYPHDTFGSDVAALTSASDLPMFEPVFFPSEITWKEVISNKVVLGSTIDRCVWFHRPAAPDDWLILEQSVPIAHDSRAFARGELRTPPSDLVASVSREVVFAPPGPAVAH